MQVIGRYTLVRCTRHFMGRHFSLPAREAFSRLPGSLLVAGADCNAPMEWASVAQFTLWAFWVGQAAAAATHKKFN